MGYIEPICKQFYWRCKYNEKIFFPIFRYVEIFHLKLLGVDSYLQKYLFLYRHLIYLKMHPVSQVNKIRLTFTRYPVLYPVRHILL